MTAYVDCHQRSRSLCLAQHLELQVCTYSLYVLTVLTFGRGLEVDTLCALGLVIGKQSQ